ncbi:MAG: acyltransferase family protein, partial [Bryobacteraceae bacterium]
VWVTSKYGRQVAMWGAVGTGLWRIVGQVSPSGTAFPLYRTDYRLDSLLWGCVIGFVLHKTETLKRITPSAWVGIFAAYLLCLRHYSPLTLLWMPMLVPLSIAGTAAHPHWRLSRALDLAPLKWIGKISYSLYLWQMVFLVRSIHSPNWWQRFPANIFLAFATATVCYYCIDVRLQQAGYRLAKRAGSNGNRKDVGNKPYGVAVGVIG